MRTWGIRVGSCSLWVIAFLLIATPCSALSIPFQDKITDIFKRSPSDRPFQISHSNMHRRYNVSRSFDWIYAAEWSNPFEAGYVGLRKAISPTTQVGSYALGYRKSRLKWGFGAFTTVNIPKRWLRGIALDGQVEAIGVNAKVQSELIVVGSVLASRKVGGALVFGGLHYPLTTLSGARSIISTPQNMFVGLELGYKEHMNLYVAMFDGTLSVGVTINGIPLAAGQSRDKRKSLRYGHPFETYSFSLR